MGLPKSMRNENKTQPNINRSKLGNSSKTSPALRQPESMKPPKSQRIDYNTRAQRTNNKNTPARTESRQNKPKVLKYSEMPFNRKKKWDKRLEKWVEAGVRINQLSPKQKELWRKQKKLLQAIYKEQFRKSVMEKRRQVISNLKKPTQYGEIVRESDRIFRIVGLRREA